MTNSDTKFEVATSDSFRRRCIYKKKHYLTVDLDIWVKITRIFYQLSQLEVTQSGTKFEVATSNCIKDNAFTRKYII